MSSDEIKISSLVVKAAPMSSSMSQKTSEIGAVAEVETQTQTRRGSGCSGSASTAVPVRKSCSNASFHSLAVLFQAESGDACELCRMGLGLCDLHETLSSTCPVRSR